MYRTPSYLEQCTTAMPVADDQFVTEPIVTIQPEPLSEEELHTLFEQAISDRLLAVSERLSRISGPLTRRPETTRHERRAHSVAVGVVPSTRPQNSMSSSLLSHTWQRSVTLVSLALLFMLVGFDLMGVLVLH